MTGSPCRRCFEVEAARDGRLTGAALASIEQHVSNCGVCAAHARALRDVSTALAALPVDDRDALSVRRQRQRILALFNETQLAPANRRSKGRPMAVAVLATSTLAALAALFVTRWHGAAPSTPRVDQGADVVVVVPEAARWSRAEEGPTTRLKLDDGELDIHVKHHGEAHGLLVKLPDGELEDIGTTFRVRVSEARTISIVVREGAIVFRRDGAGPLLLGAGESWTPDGPSVAAPPSTTASADTDAVVSPRVSPAPWTAAPQPADAEKDFRLGVDMLSAGNAAQAAGAFRHYLSHGSAPERTEDATYLLVLALHRSGDDAGAQAAARDYLSRYPHGLRRREVELLFPTSGQ